MYKHILIATDGSDLAQKAEPTALMLAKALNARATAVTVTEPWDAFSMAALAERGMPNPVADYDDASRQRRTASCGASARGPEDRRFLHDHACQR